MPVEPPLVPRESLPPAEVRIARNRVWSWALWDWASNAFTAVVTTFIFTVYLTSSSFGNEDRSVELLGFGLSVAGFVIALLAPITGQRSDRSGRRKRWLGIHTGIVVLIIAGLYFVQPAPEYLLLGIALVAVGNVFFEFAQVNYNAMLRQVSTRETIGRVSGFGWGLGYLGGIVLLIIILVGFIFPEVGWFGVTSENGMHVRVAMLVSAVWFAAFAIPVLVAVPEISPAVGSEKRTSLFESYRELGRSLKRLAQQSRTTLWFLIASAVFRDGLNGVFTFGGIIAARTFGLSESMVIVFAIAANLVAGIFTIGAGRLDDRFGAKNVMVFSLISAVLAGSAMVILHPLGATAFWITGLLLAAFVGPIQASSRGFLLRLSPAEREGELFGLYATTGRVVSFLAPASFALFVSIFGATIYGAIGIVLVVLAGLLLLIPVRLTPAQSHPQRS